MRGTLPRLDATVEKKIRKLLFWGDGVGPGPLGRDSGWMDGDRDDVFRGGTPPTYVVSYRPVFLQICVVACDRCGDARR